MTEAKFQMGEAPLYSQSQLDTAFQAGADAARRECAEIAEAKAGEYEKLGDYGVNQDYARKVEAANDIAAAIAERVGKPVKKEDNQPDDPIK